MQDKLCLGVAREIITPHLGGQLFGYDDKIRSDSVHDDLTVTAFFFKQNDKQALLLSITVCSVHTALSDEIRGKISEKTGVPFENILLCATHTHCGPNTSGMVGWGAVDYEYCNEIFIPKILLAVEKAMLSPLPVSVGVSSGKSFVGVNRRELNSDNTARLGQNPNGSFNPEMTILSFKSNEKIIANLIHYGAHGTACGYSTIITRDWMGIMTDRLESKTNAITAFFNGPEGDVGPRLTNGRTTGICDIGYAKETGGKAAFDAMEIYNKIKVYKAPTLTARNGYLKLPLLPRLSKEAAEAKRAHLIEVQKTAAERHLIHTLGKVIDSYSDGYEDKEYNEIEQNVISLDNIVFAGFPYELFSEIGMRIQRSAGELEVLPVAMANGVIGYFPTEDAVCRGGYEINMFKATNLQEYVSDVDFHLVTETLRNIGVDLDSLKK
jgi:hypothetical protein